MSACSKTIIELIEKRGENRQFTFNTVLRPGGSVRRIDA